MKPALLVTVFIVGFVALFGAESLPNESLPTTIFEIHYSGRRFDPAKLEVPANRPIELRVVNDSAERIEFESFKLHREKVVEAGKTLVLHLPALKPGTYDFFDDFHSDVPEGQISAR